MLNFKTITLSTPPSLTFGKGFLLFLLFSIAFACSALAYTIDDNKLTVDTNERVYTSDLENDTNKVLSSNGITDIYITNSGSQLFFAPASPSKVEGMNLTYHIKGNGWNKELNGAIRITGSSNNENLHQLTAGNIILEGDAEIWSYQYSAANIAIPINAQGYNLTLKSDGHKINLTGATITGTKSSSANLWYVNNNEIVNAASALSGYEGTINLVYSHNNASPTNHNKEFSAFTNNFNVTIEKGTRLQVTKQADFGPTTGATISVKDTGQLWVSFGNTVGSADTAATNKVQITGVKWGTAENNGAIRLDGTLYAAVSLTGDAKIATYNYNGNLYGTLDLANYSLNFDTPKEMTINSVISGNGKITKTGSNSLTINSTVNAGNTYTGGTTVSAGTLYLSGNNMGYSSVGTGDLVINSGAKVEAKSHNVLGSAEASRIPNVIINGGTLKPNNYLHMYTVTLNSGTIEHQGGTSSGMGLDFNNYNGKITSTGTSYIKSTILNKGTLTIEAQGGTLTLSDKITGNSGTVNLVYKNGGDISGAGTALSGYGGNLSLTYDYNNTGIDSETSQFSSFTNQFDVTIEKGTRLCVNNQAELGPESGVTVTVKDTGQLWIGRDSIVGSDATATTNNIQITGSKWGTKEDNGAIRLEGKLYAAISLTGDAKISTVNKYGYLYGTIDTSGKQLTLDTRKSDSYYGSTYFPMEVNSIISGDGSIVKTSGGSLTINSNRDAGNTYTGGTTVNEGTLYLSGKNMGYSSVGTGDLVINSGAKVEAKSHNVLGSADASHIPNVIINGGTLVPYQYMHMKSVTLNSGTIESHGSAGTGLDFNKYNGKITSTGTSTIKAAITNSSPLSIEVQNGTLSLSGAITNASVLTIDVQSGTLKTTNTIYNNGSDTKLVKTGSGSLQTSNWINNYIQIDEGDITLTGSFNGSSKRFNGSVYVNSGAKLILADKDSLGWGSAVTNMYLYGGSVENTVGNDTLEYINFYLKGGAINGASAENTMDILQNDAKYFSEATDNATAENPTVSTINAVTNLRCSGAFAVDTAENSILKFTQPIICNAGDGTITKTGKGVMELTVPSTTTGAITVSDGTLKLSENGAYAGEIVNNTKLEFAYGSDKSYSGKISGTGTIVKTDDKTLYLNTVTGSPISASKFIVSAGDLMYQGAFTGNLEIGSETSTALLSPGNSVGQLTVNGDFTLNSGSTLLIEQDATGIDKLIVNGVFDIADDSILELSMGAVIPGGTGPIIENTSGLSGKYATTEFWNSILSPTSAYYWNLSIDGNQVWAQIDANAVPEPSTWTLLILGFAGLMWRLRSKRREE